jgi:hypothetical protein
MEAGAHLPCFTDFAQICAICPVFDIVLQMVIAFFSILGLWVAVSPVPAMRSVGGLFVNSNLNNWL